MLAQCCSFFAKEIGLFHYFCQSMGRTLGSLSRFLVRKELPQRSASLQEEGTGATTGRKPNGMISDHAWGASDCLSAFEVSI